MRLALVGFVALVSCSGDGYTVRLVDDYRVVTTPGGSCGMWDERKSNPPTLISVKATCGEGLSCVGIAYYNYQPTDVAGRDFRTCLPDDALTCGMPSFSCPAPFACSVGGGQSGCIHTCTTHSDCPDTYQVCETGNCMVVPCEMPADGAANSCWTGEHCQDRICRPD